MTNQTDSSGALLSSSANRSDELGSQPRPEGGPAIITTSPSNDGSIICCDADNEKCIVQPTTCVDNFNHPASRLCQGTCPDDPMTLKCTAGGSPHCNQINLESPLVYLAENENQRNIRGRRVHIPGDWATVSEVVRGWVCGPSPVPTDIIFVVTQTSTQTSNRTSLIASAVITGTDGASQRRFQELTPTASASFIQPTKVIQTTEVAHTNTDANTGPIKTGQDQHADVTSDYWDCGEHEVVDDDDCCYEDDHIVWGAACLEEECVEIVPRARVSRQRRRRQSETGTTSASRINMPAKLEVPMTNFMTVTESARPIATTAPNEAPGLTITEAILIASTAYANQTNRSALSQVTYPLVIVTPTGYGNTTTSTGRPNSNGRPRTDIKQPGNDIKHIDTRVAGAVVGSVLGLVLLLIGSIYFRVHRRKKRDARLRQRRDSNPVSSRITTPF